MRPSTRETTGVLGGSGSLLPACSPGSRGPLSPARSPGGQHLCLRLHAEPRVFRGKPLSSAPWPKSLTGWTKLPPWSVRTWHSARGAEEARVRATQAWGRDRGRGGLRLLSFAAAPISPGLRKPAARQWSVERNAVGRQLPSRLSGPDEDPRGCRFDPWPGAGVRDRRCRELGCRPALQLRFSR